MGKKYILPPLLVSMATVPKITNCTHQPHTKECRKCCWDAVPKLGLTPLLSRRPREGNWLLISDILFVGVEWETECHSLQQPYNFILMCKVSLLGVSACEISGIKNECRYNLDRRNLWGQSYKLSFFPKDQRRWCQNLCALSLTCIHEASLCLGLCWECF